jgi:gliding motility-associated protein GldM
MEATGTVSTAGAAISLTKMNVLYVAVDNPVSISVSGAPNEKVSATISQGSLTKREGSEYIAQPASSGEATVTVFAEIDGQKKNMGSMQFRVKSIPTPVAKVGGKAGGNIDKNALASQQGVLADMEDFLFDLSCRVQQFEVGVITAQGYKSAKSSSAVFTDEQKALINGLSKGQFVIFTNIKAQGPGGIKDLRDIIFTIN